MKGVAKANVVLACLGCFALGTLWRGDEGRPLVADPVKAPAAAVPFSMEARLGGNLYLQTAAEYRACCLQIYRCAELRLAHVLRAHPLLGRPAVVMDLDETVLDNSAFQTFLYANKLEYTDPLWAEYEENFPQDVTLIPGARGFIHQAYAANVAVLFISNRSELYRTATEKVLTRLGIAGKDVTPRLYLRGKDGSNKAARREAASAGHNVLLYFGDNLRDFSESFAAPALAKGAVPNELAAAIRKRKEAVDRAACHWGIDWFVLPNPVYGEWEKLIGQNPKALLHPTSMKTPAR